jgi:tetratricopeptide (TPR) repeat protein
MSAIRATGFCLSLLLVLSAASAGPGCGGGSKKTSKKPQPVKKLTAKELYDQGVAAEQAGKSGVAIEKFERALKMKPDDFDTADHLSRLLIADQRPADGLAVARGYADRVPGDPRGFHLLSFAQIAAGDYAGAYETLTQILEIDETDAAAWDQRCRVQVSAKRLAEAVGDCRKAVELDGDNPEFLIDLGSALHQSGQLEEAALHLRNALQVAPEDGRAHLILGVVLRDQFEVKEALSHHMKAVRFDPENERAYFELGLTQNRLGDNLAAEVSLAKAVELAPEDPMNWYAYGEILRNLEKWEQAVPAYRKAVELDPGHPKANVKLGYVLYSLDRLGDAEVALTAAVQAHPEDPFAHYNLGLVYAKADKLKLAIEALEKFLSLADKNDGEIPKAKQKIRELKAKLKKQGR